MLTTPRVMVIEDDRAQREMLTEILTRYGFSVVCASNGQIGLNMLEHTWIDLVLTDVLMPEADGLEVIRILKRRHPDLPILAVSGGGNMIPANMGLEFALTLGADGILHKPYTTVELISAIQGVFPPSEHMEWIH